MARAEQVDFLLAGVTDSSGQPLSGGKVYTYKAGTLTPATLYTEQDKSSDATNPIILDSRGRAEVWGDTAYYFEVKNSADVSQFTIDGLVYGKNDSFIWCGDANNDGDDNFFNLLPSPSIPTVEDGMIFSFVAKDNSVTAVPVSYLSVSGHTQREFFLPDGATYLTQGDIVDGSLYLAQYLGGAYDHYRLIKPDDLRENEVRMIWCGDAVAGGGPSNTFNVTPSPSVPTVEDGMIFSFVAKHNSTGSNLYGAFSVSGHTQRDLFLKDGVTYMSTGSILSGSVYQVQYFGGAYDHYRLLTS